MTPLLFPPSALEATSDEAVVYRGLTDTETICLFVSTATDVPGCWRLRCVFLDRTRQTSDQVIVIQRAQSGVYLRIERAGKPPFLYSSPGFARDGKSPGPTRRRKVMPS